MARCADIEEILRTHRDELAERFHVKYIGIFGSYAREKETGKSDVDILVEFSEPIGWEYVDLKEYLEEIFGKPVDVVTKKALKPQLRETILEEVRNL